MSKNFELIESKGVKVYIDPSATMFLAWKPDGLF